MKKLSYLLSGLVLFTATIFGQDYLRTVHRYNSQLLFPEHITFGPFDLSDSLIFVSDGDTIRCLDLNTGLEIEKFNKPEGYDSFASFITISPDGSQIWAGFTVFGSTDDRIYSIDVETGKWKLQAKMPGNIDLEFWNGTILVSGLNSTNWNDPGSIFVLDTSGSDQHRKIIEIGGYSAGMAIDNSGNLYYGTSFAMDPNAIFRWDSAEISAQVRTPGVDTLKIENADKITNLPSGANDVEIDDGGNLIFNCNDMEDPKVVGLWNGIEGENMNFDTIAVATGAYAWLGKLKSQGSIDNTEDGNRIITISIGSPLTEISLDYAVGISVIDKSHNNSTEIELFPNPNFGRFEIRTGSPDGIVVNIYSLTGKMVYENHDYKPGQEIDFNFHPAGSYVIRIVDADKITSRVFQKL